jgi:hypothetical protein
MWYRIQERVERTSRSEANPTQPPQNKITINRGKSVGFTILSRQIFSINFRPCWSRPPTRPPGGGGIQSDNYSGFQTRSDFLLGSFTFFELCLTRIYCLLTVSPQTSSITERFGPKDGMFHFYRPGP